MAREDYSLDPRFAYACGKTTIVELENAGEVPDLEAAFVAAMTELKARRVFESKSADIPQSSRRRGAQMQLARSPIWRRIG